LRTIGRSDLEYRALHYREGAEPRVVVCVCIHVRRFRLLSGVAPVRRLPSSYGSREFGQQRDWIERAILIAQPLLHGRAHLGMRECTLIERRRTIANHSSARRTLDRSSCRRRACNFALLFATPWHDDIVHEGAVVVDVYPPNNQGKALCPIDRPLV